MSNASLPVTIAATRRAKPGHEAALEHWAEQLCAAASAFPGFERSDVHGDAEKARAVTVTLTFASAMDASAWEVSAVRAELLARAQRLTDGPPVPASPPMQALRPSRVRTALVVWAGLTPFALLLNVVAAPSLAALPVLARTVLTTVVLVPLALFVGVPLVNRALSVRYDRTRR